MDRDRRARLAEAERLNRTVLDLYPSRQVRRGRASGAQALAIRKEEGRGGGETVLGEGHPLTATSLNNLAMLLDSQGDYAAAKPLYEQALAINKAVLGERHPATATSLNNLAGLLDAQGDYAAAKPLYEQAVAISRNNLDLLADAQTERQQMVMADLLRSGLDAFLSASPQVGIADGVSYRQILAWKGAILERQRRLRDLRRLLVPTPGPRSPSPPPSGSPSSAGSPPWPWPSPAPTSRTPVPPARRADPAQGPARG